MFLTTLDFDAAYVHMMCSQRGGAGGTRVQRYVLAVPRIQGNFTGTGDLCSALILAWMDKHPDELALVLEKVASVLQSVLIKTMASLTDRERSKPEPPEPKKVPPPELRVIECVDAIRYPEVRARCTVFPKAETVGIIFDLPGTLTKPMPGMLTEVRRVLGVDMSPSLSCASGSAPTATLLDHLGQLPPEVRGEAEGRVRLAELEAYDALELMPGVFDVLTQLHRQGVRLAVATANHENCYRRFCEFARVPFTGFFEPVYHRGAGTELICKHASGETRVASKPDPSLVHAVCEAWGCAPQAVLVVGHSAEDMACGARAGARAVLMHTSGHNDELLNCEHVYSVVSRLESLMRYT